MIRRLVVYGNFHSWQGRSVARLPSWITKAASGDYGNLYPLIVWTGYSSPIFPIFAICADSPAALAHSSSRTRKVCFLPTGVTAHKHAQRCREARLSLAKKGRWPLALSGCAPIKVVAGCVEESVERASTLRLRNAV